jgi:hypothetical protein
MKKQKTFKKGSEPSEFGVFIHRAIKFSKPVEVFDRVRSKKKYRVTIEEI